VHDPPRPAQRLPDNGASLISGHLRATQTERESHHLAEEVRDPQQKSMLFLLVTLLTFHCTLRFLFPKEFTVGQTVWIEIPPRITKHPSIILLEWLALFSCAPFLHLTISLSSENVYFPSPCRLRWQWLGRGSLSSPHRQPHSSSQVFLTIFEPASGCSVVNCFSSQSQKWCYLPSYVCRTASCMFRKGALLHPQPWAISALGLIVVLFRWRDAVGIVNLRCCRWKILWWRWYVTWRISDMPHHIKVIYPDISTMPYVGFLYLTYGEESVFG